MTIGILGNCGILAGISFTERLIELYALKKNVTNEYDYPRYILYGNPKLPSRSRHIFFGEESPLEILKEDIKKINSYGVKFIVMPCNTVHYYYNELQSVSSVKILNMIKIVSDYINTYHFNSKVLILGTEATYKSKLYNNYGMKNNTYYNDIKTVREIIDDVKHQKYQKIHYVNLKMF